jgi:GWxTD domain-containing protein
MNIRAFLSIVILSYGASALADERVDKLTPGHRTWLEEEVVYIITDKERDAFLSIESVEQRDRFIEAFWRRRDPDRTTPENEFKDEHYRRFEFANENFNRQTTRAGWQTDQGRIFIILGQPRERNKFEAHYNLAFCELWTYQAPPGSVLPPFFQLLFFKQYDAGEYKLYSPQFDGPLRLVRGIDRFTVDPMVAMQELLDIDPNLAHAALTYDMSETPDFQTGRASLGSEIIVARIADVPKRSIRTDYVDAWLRYGNRISADYSFNFIPSRSVFSVLVGPQGVPFVHYRIEVDPQNFRLVAEEDESKYYTILDVSLSVTDQEGKSVLAQDKEIYLELTPNEIRQFDASPFAYQDDFPLVPGDYQVSLILRNRAATQYTVAERELSLSAFTPNEPGLSDIVLGYESSIVADDAESDDHRTFQIGKQRIQPAAGSVFFIGDTAHAFFQVLGANPGQTLQFTLSNETAGVVQERTVSVADHVPGAVDEAFSLSDIGGGAYRLRVVLADADGSSLAERDATLNVSPRNPVPRAWVHSRSFDARVPGALALAVGSQFQALGKHELAARALAQAIVADPDSAEARWRLAGIHLGWREPDEALSLLLPLEEAHGEQYEVAAGLGFAFYMKDDVGSAVQYLDKAVTIRPPTPGLLNTLAECHERMGNATQAKQLLERSLELDPEQEAVRDKLATMGG